LEIETYTWNVLPRGEDAPLDLVEGLQMEIQAALKLLADITKRKASTS
jgi:hypothetical protein